MALLSNAEHHSPFDFAIFRAMGVLSKCRSPWQTVTILALLPLSFLLSHEHLQSYDSPFHKPNAAFEKVCLTPGVYQLQKSSRSKPRNKSLQLVLLSPLHRQKLPFLIQDRTLIYSTLAFLQTNLESDTRIFFCLDLLFLALLLSVKFKIPLFKQSFSFIILNLDLSLALYMFYSKKVKGIRYLRKERIYFIKKRSA